LLALNGSGFTPNGPVQVGYTGFPAANLYGSGAKEVCCADSGGGLTALVIGAGTGGAGCDPSTFNGTVTIGIEDPIAFTAIQFLVPGKY